MVGSMCTSQKLGFLRPHSAWGQTWTQYGQTLLSILEYVNFISLSAAAQD
jgi:hypothetical protein